MSRLLDFVEQLISSMLVAESKKIAQCYQTKSGLEHDLLNACSMEYLFDVYLFERIYNKL
jgi:hypothetical protein